jgi:hypothetical protein
MDRELDVAAGQHLFADGMPFLAGFDLGTLHSVRLEELLKFFGRTPFATKVVVLQLSAAEIADDRVVPAGQFYGEARSRRCEQLVLSADRRGQAETLTGRCDRCGVSNLRLNLNDV